MFVLRPMVEQLCQRLNDAQKSLVHLQLEAWVRLLPPEDVSACLNDRHRWWSRNFYFNVPVGAADCFISLDWKRLRRGADKVKSQDDFEGRADRSIA